MEKQIITLPIKPALQRLTNVAAYARVSSGKDAMLHSLAAQVSYYSDLIQKASWLALRGRLCRRSPDRHEG